MSNNICTSEALCMVGEFIKTLFPVGALVASNIVELSCLFFRGREIV